MKTKLSVLALAMCGMLAFTSCDDDNDNFHPTVVPQAITDAINEMYRALPY